MIKWVLILWKFEMIEVLIKKQILGKKINQNHWAIIQQLVRAKELRNFCALFSKTSSH
jgi:hypothetical protein